MSHPSRSRRRFPSDLRQLGARLPASPLRPISFALTLVLLCLQVSLGLEAGQSDRELLAEQGVRPDQESVSAFLDTLREERGQQRTWIALLGSESFQERKLATKRLKGVAKDCLDLLEKAESSDDPEIRARAKEILASARESQSPPGKRRLLPPLFRVLAQEKPAGLTGLLLEHYSGLTGDVEIGEGKRAILALASPEDLALLETATEHAESGIREIALLAIDRVGDDGTARKHLQHALEDPSDFVRYAAAEALLGRGDHDALHHLAELLSSKDPTLRMRAVNRLRSLSGQRFGYQFATPVEAAIVQWKEWIEQEGAQVELGKAFQFAGLEDDRLVLWLRLDGAGPAAGEGEGGAGEAGAVKHRVALDSSVAKNHATLHGGKFVARGQGNGARFLSGENEYVRVANSDTLELTTQLTVAVWLRPASFGPGGYGNELGYIVSKGDALWWNPAMGLGLAKRSTSRDPKWPGKPGPMPARFTIGAPGAPANGGGMTIESKTFLEKDKWYHLAGTFDGEKVRIYVNGKLEREAAYRGLIRSDKAPVLIGGANLGNTDWGNKFTLNGAVDDVRIYREALAPEEVALLHSWRP